MSFAARCPDSNELVLKVKQKMVEPWWAEEQIVERYERLLRGYGIPGWLVRLRRKILHS
jgi:hypothetical protein